MAGEGDPFGAGPFAAVQAHFPTLRPHHVEAWRRAGLTALIAWVPLVVLGALEHVAVGSGMRDSVLFDFAAYGRYLVAAPALSCAGWIALPEMARVVNAFTDSGIVRKEERARFDAIVASTKALLGSRVTDVVLLVLAYGLTFATSPQQYPPEVRTWVTPQHATFFSGLPGSLSLAGWWRMLVSQPLFLLLQAMWLWRLVLWTRLLWKTTRLNLRLVAAHPDRRGGLAFVLVPIRGFAILAFGIGALAAGSVARSVIVDGTPLQSFRYIIAGQVLLVLVLFAGPMLILAGPLVRLKTWGIFHYGKAATEVGRKFQQRWLGDEAHADSDALGAPDFSATTDLFSIVANVDAINPLVLDLRMVAMLAVATLLPYVPLVLAVWPIEQILDFAASALR